MKLRGTTSSTSITLNSSTSSCSLGASVLEVANTATTSSSTGTATGTRTQILGTRALHSGCHGKGILTAVLVSAKCTLQNATLIHHSCVPVESQLTNTNKPYASGIPVRSLAFPGQFPVGGVGIQILPTAMIGTACMESKPLAAVGGELPSHCK